MFSRSMYCAYCEHDAFSIVKRRIANGTYQVYKKCNKCGKNFHGSAIYLPQRNLILSEYPTVRDDEGINPPCEVCGEFYTESHHWAPIHLFDDAYKWPTSYLCRECHACWHLVVEGIKI